MIVVDGLTRRYGPVVALDGVTFEVPDEGVVTILGPSGSGKTTLLRLVAGLEAPEAGRIVADGRLLSAPGRVVAPHLRGMGLVPQSSALWPHMTVAQNVLFGLHGLPRSEARRRLEHLLERTGLTALAGRRPHQISGGEARRVALARALAPRPRCLLMDEPLTNLDGELRATLLALIRDLVCETRASLLYVTHQLDEAAALDGRVLRLRAGRVAGVEGARDG
jgi:iron(III) transport system ATP-binding protein